MSDDNTTIVYPSDGDTLLASIMTNNLNALIARIENMGTGVTAELTQAINEVKGIAETALSEADNSVQLTGNQTIGGTVTFTNPIIIPNSNKVGRAVSLQYYDTDDSEKRCIQLGNLKVQWGTSANVSKNQQKTINFLKAFSNSAYTFVFSYSPSGMVATNNGLSSRSTQSCIVNCYADANSSWTPKIVWLAIGT